MTSFSAYLRFFRRGSEKSGLGGTCFWKISPGQLGEHSQRTFELCSKKGLGTSPDRGLCVTTAAKFHLHFSQPNLGHPSKASSARMAPHSDGQFHSRPPPLLHLAVQRWGGDGWVSRDALAEMPSDKPRAQLAFKDSMIRGILQFTLRIAFRCVLHRCKSQDIRC